MQLDIKRTSSYDPEDNQIPDADQQHILTVLSCVAFIFPQIGYCQGMNYLAHAIYEQTQDVDLSIEIFSGFIMNKCLVGLYSGQVAEYHLQAFILERCIAYSLP